MRAIIPQVKKSTKVAATMLRLFLKEKIGSTPSKRSRPKSSQNRRAAERFSLDRKHLTMMNEQDIFVLRDMSSKGFSSQVSSRALERLAMGDVYSARIRHLGEMFDLEARVSWKSGGVVGFELVDADQATLHFMQRLIEPMALAQSLRLVEASFTKEAANRRTWYHGDGDTDLYIWNDANQAMCSWQLVSKDIFIDWNSVRGLQTGVITVESKAANLLNTSELRPLLDERINPQTFQFARDLLFAMAIEEKDEILETLVDP
jgi:hypothetical protein